MTEIITPLPCLKSCIYKYQCAEMYRTGRFPCGAFIKKEEKRLNGEGKSLEEIEGELVITQDGDKRGYVGKGLVVETV